MDVPHQHHIMYYVNITLPNKTSERAPPIDVTCRCPVSTSRVDTPWKLRVATRVGCCERSRVLAGLTNLDRSAKGWLVSKVLSTPNPVNGWDWDNQKTLCNSRPTRIDNCMDEWRLLVRVASGNPYDLGIFLGKRHSPIHSPTSCILPSHGLG